MALRSLKQTYERMVNELQSSGSSASYNDLKVLKEKIDTMYRYRNDEIQDVDPRNNGDDTPGVIANVCHQHFFRSFDEFQKRTGVSYSLSIGDLNNAMDQMAFCTCNSRSIQGCDCVLRQLGNTCNCNARNPIDCGCVYRYGGKYSPSCVCHTRYAGCDCVTRTSSQDCDCHGRCSCNVVKEYTMTDPKTITNCTCVSRQFGDACQCHTRSVAQTTPCECQSRAVECNGVSNAPHGWDKYCGEHEKPTTRGACQCNARTSPQENDYCVCVERTSTVMCEYHIVK